MSDVTSVKVFHMLFTYKQCFVRNRECDDVHIPCNSLLTRQTLFDFYDAVHGSVAHIRHVLLSTSQCLKQISNLTNSTEQNPVIFISDFPA